jgi:hypothetical protein
VDDVAVLDELVLLGPELVVAELMRVLILVEFMF